MKNLAESVVRGGIARMCGQPVIFLLRLGFMAVMARILQPEDFGLVAMVVAVTGIYDLFTSAGLSLATIQRSTITDEEISNLFWVNLVVGMMLCLLCIVTAPLLVTFYKESRLFWITIVIGIGFVLNAAGVQHSALLQRQLRYVDLTIIELTALSFSYVLAISLAALGFGYWALVASIIALPAVSSGLVWTFTAWIPTLPRRQATIRSMLSFGGTITLNNLVIYVAYNVDKLLIGRFWGPGALGIYGTSYQLANVPTSNVTSAIGGITFAALSRLQHEPARRKTYFMKGYALVISITAPVTIWSALFADDIVLLIFGPRWVEASTILRLLTPAILVFSIINPAGWLLQSAGLQGRSLKVALVIAPLVIAAYIIGLPYGPKGVAVGFSIAMTLWLVPHISWCLHGTMISPVEFFFATCRPFSAAALAATLAFAATQFWFGQLQSPFLRLGLGGALMAGSYLFILLFIMGGKEMYLDSIRRLRDSGRFASE